MINQLAQDSWTIFEKEVSLDRASCCSLSISENTAVSMDVSVHCASVSDYIRFGHLMMSIAVSS